MVSEMTTQVSIAYKKYLHVIHQVMDPKLREITFFSDTRQGKSRYKPYWNRNLQNEWDNVCNNERHWLEFRGS